MQLTLLSLSLSVVLFFLQRNKQAYKLASVAVLSIGILFALPILHTYAQSTPYNGSARAIPGIIEAEDFDNGGEGVGYHDAEALNQAFQYRTSEGVDIAVNPTGGYAVGWTVNGEWLKYTVNVQTTGSYALQVRLATPYSGESLHIEMDGTTIATVNVPVTGSWDSWQNVNAGNVSLTAGTHVMRVYEDAAGFNFDSVTFSVASTSNNNAPTANAGTDKFISLPTNSVTLSGSGTDSDGSIVSYAWTKTAGGVATIASPSSASTTISGLTQGTYNFRLTVTDNGGLTAFDDVLVTVSSSSPVQVRSTTPGGGYAVTITDPNGGTYSAYLHLPSDYSTSSKTYPLVVFLHGVGEAGTDLSLIYNNSNAGGPAYFVEHNGLGAYTNPADGKSYEFIVLAPQTTWDSTSGVNLNNLLQGFVPTYRVDTNRVYVTGLSAGGKGTVEYMLHNGWTPAYPIPATVPMSEALTVQSGWGANIAGQNIRVWGFGSDPADTWGTQTKILVNDMNTAVPGIARYTNYSGGHCCWGTYYNPAYKETINGVSMNIYQWLLQYKGGSSTTPPPANVAPTANAGVDKSITLPTSSTSLSGSGTDSDGTIVSYTWSQQFGPSTATISSPSSANTNVSNLIAGSYRFRLTVTDNGGATGYDDVNVTVDAAATTTQAPYGGSARAIPGTIQAEDFDTGGEGVAYHDSNTINSGGAYRSSEGVDMEASYDTGGGYTVGWTTDGEWLEYTVNVQSTGAYSIEARLGTPNTGKTLRMEMDGTLIGTMTVPNTGGWQTWQSQLLPNINLTAGMHVLRLTFNTGSTTDSNAGFNINYIKFTSGSTANTAPTVNAGSDQVIVLPSTSVTLSGTATDSDGSIASYAWTKTSGGTVTIASPSSASTTVSGLAQGVYTFRLTATDNSGASSYDDVNVTVNAQVPIGSQVRIPIDPATMVINENVVGDETKLFDEQSLLQLDANGNPITTATNPVFCPDIWNEPAGHTTCWSIFQNKGVRELSWPAKLTIDLKATYNVTDAYIYMSGPSANGTNDAIEVRASDDPFNFSNKVGGSKLVTQYPYSQWVRIPLTSNNYRYLELVITSDAGKIGEIVFMGTKTGTTVTENTPSGAWQKQHYTMDTFIGTNVSFGMGDGYDKDYDYQWGTLRNYGGFRWTFDLNDNFVPSAYQSAAELRRIASGTGVKSFNAQMGATQNMVDPADPLYNNAGAAYTDRKPIDYTLCKGTVLVNGVASCLGVADKPASYAHKAYLDKKYAIEIGPSSQFKQEFVELGNESDGSWNQAGYFNPYELAAMMSADYDGHCDILRYNGEHVGIKNGDPNMKVLMPGLVQIGGYDMRYMNAMNFWWQHNRPCAQKIPFDAINFHFYASSSGGQGNLTGYGVSPEEFGMRESMQPIVDFRNKYAPKADVAVTEFGYDSYPQVFPDPTVSWCKDTVYGGSIIAARPIGSYDSDEVAGQWIARTYLEMAAAGIDFANQFWLGDEYKINTVCGTFAASGLLKQPYDAINYRPQYVPRPGWYYAQTLRTQLKGMKYDSDKKVNGITVMKFRDVSNTNRVAYVVWSPTSTGYTNNTFTLSLDRAGAAQVIKLVSGSETGQIDQTTSTQVSSVVIPISERPTLVQVNENGTAVGGPVVSAGIDQAITLPTSTTTLNGSATSGNAVTSYAWTKTAGGTATIASPSSASTTVSGLTQGVYTFHLVVTDNTGASGSDDVNVTVMPRPNTAPAVNAGVDQTIALPTNSVSLTGTAVDADNDSMTYAWTKTAGGTATINSSSSLGTTISGLTQGTYTFMLTATDSQGASGTDTVTITVNGAPNVSPTANAGADQTIARLSGSFTLTGSGTDSDGTIASYRWIQVSGPAATILTPTTASTKVSATSTGVYIFRLTVTDNLGAVGTDDVSVTAQTVKINKNPHVKAATTSPITTTATSLKLSGTATDEDGTITTTEWTQVSGPQASIESPTSLETTISGLDSNTYEFTLTATDNEGGIATDTVRIIASRPATSGGGGGGGGGSSGGGSSRSDERPTVSAGGDQTITLPISSVILNGTGSDAEGSVTYEWKQLSGHAGTKIDSAKSAKTTVSGLTEGRYVFGLTVTDKKGQESTDQAVVTVLKVSSPITTGGGNSNRVKINVQTTLRVRADASISSAVMGSVRGGIGGTVVQEKTGPSGIQWLQVQFDNGTTGWVSKTYTVPDQSVTTPVGSRNTTTSTRATITARLLNVRASAGGPVIGQVTSGNGGAVLSDTGSWLQIKFDSGTTGWVSKAYTSSTTSGGTVSTPSTGTVTTTAGSLNVRTAPNGAVAGKVPFGTTGSVINRVNGWVLVQFPTVTGYVSSAYVR